MHNSLVKHGEHVRHVEPSPRSVNVQSLPSRAVIRGSDPLRWRGAAAHAWTTADTVQPMVAQPTYVMRIQRGFTEALQGISQFALRENMSGNIRIDDA